MNSCWRPPATLKSQARASSAPPPSATPSTMATLGIGSACTSSQQGVTLCSSRSGHCLQSMPSRCSADVSTLQAVMPPHAMQLQQLEALVDSVDSAGSCTATRNAIAAAGGARWLCADTASGQQDTSRRGCLHHFLLSKLEEALSDVLDSAAAAAWWPGRQPKQGAPKLSAPAAADV